MPSTKNEHAKRLACSFDCGPGENRTPICRMQTDCSATKLQAPAAASQWKSQYPNSKSQTGLNIGYWNLGIVWLLLSCILVISQI